MIPPIQHPSLPQVTLSFPSWCSTRTPKAPRTIQPCLLTCCCRLKLFRQGAVIGECWVLHLVSHRGFPPRLQPPVVVGGEGCGASPMPPQGASPSALPRSLPANVAAMLARHPVAGTRADTAGREFRVSGSQASTAADEGPSTRTETLKAHLDRLQAGIRECTAERLRLQRRCHGGATPRKLSEHQSDVALVLFVLSAASPDACLAYLRRAVGDRNATVLKDIEERFLRMPLHEVAKIDQTDATWKLKAENRAKTFLREWNLATWVRSQNADKGVAPAFRHVLSRKRSVEADPRRETASAVAATDKCCKQWVRRWMHRWHGARRKLSVQEATNVEELNRKAGNPGHIF